MIVVTEAGLYCQEGDFYIDPWLPVERAILTHAHADHARSGSNSYLCAQPAAHILRHRLGPTASIQTANYGEPIKMHEATVSLHPAGHILGSAQVRVEHKGEVWVVSGDYKLGPDPTCEPFELVKCNTFITESTFGLPIYRWLADHVVFEQINSWWQQNILDGRTSLLLCYALGKAQRILHGIDAGTGPIFTHGSVQVLNDVYRSSGINLPETRSVTDQMKGTSFSGALILAPLSVQGTPWLRRLGNISTGFASGWMRIRGMRRRRALDRGFVLSDHADWNGLLATIAATEAEQVFVTHGYSQVLVRHLTECGINAAVMETKFEGEAEDISLPALDLNENAGSNQVRANESNSEEI